MRAYVSLFIFAFVLTAVGERISVSFPAERQRLPSVAETYVIGAVDGGRTETLYVNGLTTDVHRTGAFIQMVPVKPGENELTIRRGGSCLVRKFVVAEKVFSPPSQPVPVIESDDSPLIGEISAWKATGILFANRVRSAIDSSDTIFFLPKNFVLSGAQVKNTDWVVVWLENRRGFIHKKAVTQLGADVPIPPRALVAPNPVADFPDQPPYGKPPSAVCVCIDAGHGGHDPGVISPHGWREKDVNLMQARAIRDALEKAGFNVVMTRDGDSSPGLLDRPNLAYERRADAFVSVHHNSTMPQRDPRLVRHTATYASNSNGLFLAQCIQKHIAQVMAPVSDRGAQMKSLAVCRNPAVPSCLLEVDFVNLPEGEEESWNPVRQKKIADAVVYGILDWMMPPPPESEPVTQASELVE